MIEKGLWNDTIAEGAQVSNIFLEISSTLTLPVAIMGLAGNIVSCFVFIANRRNDVVSFQYLTYLSVVDSAYIITFLIWEEGDILFTFDMSDITCKLLVAAMRLFRTMDGLLLMTLSLERLTVIRFPIWASINVTKFRRSLLIVLVTVAAMLITFPVIAITGKRTIDKCDFIFSASMSACNTIFIVNLLKAFKIFIPGITICISNIIIVHSAFNSWRTFARGEDPGRKRNKGRLLVMTVTISSLYVALLFPRELFWTTRSLLLRCLAIDIWNSESIFIQIHPLLHIFSLSNYAINFIIYSVVLDYFRQTIIDFILCRPLRQTTKMRNDIRN